MTKGQGKLIAAAVITAAVIAVIVAAQLRPAAPQQHQAAPADLAFGPSEVVLTTAFGPLHLRFYPQLAPLHVAQFLKLVHAGVYTGATVIRIEKDFVVQIDATYARPTPLSPADQALITSIPAEFSDVKHHRRTLSMARYDDPNSATASFSILLGTFPHMDGAYTVFGEMDEASEDTLRKIEAQPVVPGTTKPLTTIPVLKAEVVAKTP